ncbi:MAG TPA: thiamine biosynthesis protein ThiS [Psychrobacter sp.]|uniref:Sulfur carrier protein ThiS n=1 Tax=Psychrobacter pasteurii TaxID=1945520 RepID=A0A1R4EF17_9GAMM|nr:sulfur carrier protein ThiS [Psychrobacter pasteurii]SJM37094.1 sulfur carrier protein ThiS [Psychrobacter pasteurii]HAO60150.1 thiamine biosynthesis protein ThiS [Psychrobacter sp.]HJH09426.1 sulfur carrier protein ThiS [Psychrobacter pasteurii]
MYTITVNGEKQQTEQLTVKAVLDELQLTQGRYAVEINGELIPKSELAATNVEQEMVIEVVQAVGGG